MAEKVLLEYKQDIDEFTLIPSSGGVFEVYKNGEKIHSKSETGKYPNADDIIQRLRD